MLNPIAGPDPLAPVIAATGAASAAGPSNPATAAGRDFKQVLLDSLDEVNRLQTEADSRVEALYRGDTDNVAEVFTAVNKAGIAFDLLMEIRNKLLEAYQEINQMRV